MGSDVTDGGGHRRHRPGRARRRHGLARRSRLAAGFLAALNAYRASIGISTSGQRDFDSERAGRNIRTVTPPAFNPAGERSLDVGVVTAINPQSQLIVYAGSGTDNGAHSNGFTAYQSAFWDTANNPGVITSSFSYAVTGRRRARPS